MTNAELISFDGWTFRARPSQTKNPRLLILLHGWTGDENSMWLFARKISPIYWIIAPRAPHPADPSGFSWRRLDPASFGFPTLKALAPAADGLIRLIDAYAASVGVDATQFDAAGFSQGGAMVNTLGFLHPSRIRKMAVLAGFVPDGAEGLALQKPLAGKNIFVAHGSQDQVIPLDRARASLALLEQAGAQVAYCEDEVGHKLGSICLRGLERYLQD